MKWTKRLVLFGFLLVVAAVIINFDTGISKVTGGILIGVAVSYLMTILATEWTDDGD